MKVSESERVQNGRFVEVELVEEIGDVALVGARLQELVRLQDRRNLTWKLIFGIGIWKNNIIIRRATMMGG